jgi:hypothetical protein
MSMFQENILTKMIFLLVKKKKNKRKKSKKNLRKREKESTIITSKKDMIKESKFQEHKQYKKSNNAHKFRDRKMKLLFHQIQKIISLKKPLSSCQQTQLWSFRRRKLKIR